MSIDVKDSIKVNAQLTSEALFSLTDFYIPWHKIGQIIT